jgi:hypothetical protein
VTIAIEDYTLRGGSFQYVGLESLDVISLLCELHPRDFVFFQGFLVTMWSLLHTECLESAGLLNCCITSIRIQLYTFLTIATYNTRILQSLLSLVCSNPSTLSLGLSVSSLS